MSSEHQAGRFNRAPRVDRLQRGVCTLNGNYEVPQTGPCDAFVSCQRVSKVLVIETDAKGVVKVILAIPQARKECLISGRCQVEDPNDFFKFVKR